MEPLTATQSSAMPNLYREVLRIREHYPPEGLKLAEEVRPFYEKLFLALAGRFGQIEFGHSRFIRAIVTGWEIARPEHFLLDDRITLEVSLKKINGGEWFEQQKLAKHSIAQMLLAVHNNLSLLDGQPYDKRMSELNDFFTDGTGVQVKIRFGHEPEPTLWVLKRELMPENEVGLAECQAYIVISNDDGILGIIKFTPSPTLK